MKSARCVFPYSAHGASGKPTHHHITLIRDKSSQGLGLDNIHTHKWRIMTCSAMTGENLQEGLQWVVQDAKDRLFLY